jgi:hypothetical protein
MSKDVKSDLKSVVVSAKPLEKFNWADASEGVCKFGGNCLNDRCRFEHVGARPKWMTGKSEAVNPKKAKKKSKKVKPSSGVTEKRTIPQLVEASRVLIAKRVSTQQQKVEFMRKYVTVTVDAKVDTSPFDDTLKLLDLEISMLKNAVRSVQGMKPFRINLFEENTFNSNGSGVTLGSLTVDPSLLTEFASLAALFDEYKCVSGVYHFSVNDWNVSTASVNSQGVVAYDPSDGGVPTSTVSLAAKQQMQIVAFGTVNAGATAPTHVHSAPLKFEWKVPPGVFVPAGATASEGSSNWQPTTTSNGYQPYGWIKFAKVGGHNSTNQISGMQVYHVDFRCRE